MKRTTWSVTIGVALLALSAGLYALQIALFQRPNDTGFYLLQDLAFLPFQVLLATFIVDRLLTRREKQTLLNKMNMVIGAFYAEVGTELLKRLLAFDTKAGVSGPGLVIQGDWTPRRFADAIEVARKHASSIECRCENLEELQRFLLARRDFLLRLLENPNLLEHDTFTDSLWAVFHLTDELAHRTDLRALPDTDVQHLAGDIDRAYKCIVAEWLAYMRNLKRDYPYLFSLALRTNPFDPAARVEVGPPRAPQTAASAVTLSTGGKPG
jgi:hypothetical protein